MKVRFLPPSPKAGTIEHLEPHRAQSLIDAGFAELIPYKGYQDRLKDEEELRLASQPKAEALWGIKESLLKVMVVKTFNSEILYYDSPPSDCPPSIRQRWQFAADRIQGMRNDLATPQGHEAQARRPVRLVDL